MRTLVFALALVGLTVALPGDVAAQEAKDERPAMTLHIGVDGVARLMPASSVRGIDLPLPGRRGDRERADRDGPWDRRDRDEERDGGPPPFVGDLLSTVLGGIFGSGGLLSSLPIPGNR